MLKFNEILIGVSTYNGEKTLEKTLRSLEQQTIKNFSVFISDDNSTDNTIEIIKKFSSRNDNFYYEVNKKNLGMISNINKLFTKSNCKYFAWVDQDDYRDKDFLKDCYYKLEKNTNAALAYAYTGVKNKEENILMHINTINSIHKQKNVIKRYKNLLNNFHDTIVYSLIRSSCLQNTNLWTNINGSANRLIFELSLEGEFMQVEKLLSFYNGKGISNRYDFNYEFFRQSKVKRKFYQIPFLILFLCQVKDIFVKKLSLYVKLRIFLALSSNFLKINTAKFIYRLVSKVFFKKFDHYVYKFILKIIPENKDINQIVDKKKFEEFYPTHYPYKKIKGINYLK